MHNTRDMGYWKSKVLPKIKKVFEKNGAKKTAAAEATKSFDESKVCMCTYSVFVLCLNFFISVENKQHLMMCSCMVFGLGGIQ